LQQKGLLRRFSINCYGHQQTLEEIRAEKAEKFKELKQAKTKKNEKDYEEWFLRYRPEDEITSSKKAKRSTKSKTNKKIKFKTTRKKRGRGGLFY
jgi:hypothetical protein